MVEEALPSNLPRRLGRYDVVGGLAIRGEPTRSLIVIGTVRSPSSMPTAPAAFAASSSLALSFSPAGPDEGTTTFQKPVAIKRIAPTLVGNSERLTPFLDSARAATGVRHANVLRIREVGQVEDDVFLVMDFIPGESAASLMRQLHSRGETLGFKLAAHIIAEACAGLEAGHALGMLHDQLTPRDLFIGYDGSVRVLDIGIAAARSRLAPDLLGEEGLEYASPERCKKEPLDRRSDVFSLGAMLSELITGLSPFERARKPDMIRAICEEPIVPPRNIVPGLPELASTITMTALERDKGARYATTLSLRQALIGLRRSLGAAPSPSEELARLMKRLFETRVRDKQEMLKRIKLGASLAGLDVLEVDESAPESAAPPLPAKSAAPPLPAKSAAPPLPTKSAEASAAVIKDSTSPSGSVAPHKSNPPDLVEYKEPSVIITSPGAVTPAVAQAEPAHAEARPPGLVDAESPMLEPMEAIAGLPSRKPARSILPLVLVFLLLPVIGIALALGFRRAPPDEKAAQPTRSPTTATSATLPVVVASAALTNEVPTAPASTSVASASAASVESSTATTSTVAPATEESLLHIETIPPHATIFIANVKKGSSPIDLKVPKSAEAITVELRAPGYQTMKERVIPDVNQRLKLTLVAAARGPAPAKSLDYRKFE